MIGRSSNLTCVKCGRLVAPAAGFCPNCGTQLGDPAFAPPATDLGTMAGTSLDASNPGPATASATEALTISGTELGTSLDSPSPIPRVPKGDGPFQVGQHVGPRYTIIRLLGIGGMGAVYQAFDHELGVVVAIKVIRPEVMADPFAAADLERRFKQELLLARQVTHKNVVRIHELGEFEGIKFLTMPFIEGQELSTLIQRSPHLPLERVLKIARGIATGLEAAHAAGVVHRDLKPANVMVDKSGEALIMDFGIARSTGGANPAPTGGGAPGTANWSGAGTLAGSVVGTVQYMAPEQARAEPVDHRADIYAFGLILYDMLLHQPRSRHAPTALDELMSRMQAAPPAPRSIDHTIPEPVDRLVMRCLQPDAAQRFQTTPELVAALNRLDDRGHLLPVLRRVSRQFVAAVVGGVLVLLAGTYVTTRWLAAPPTVHETTPVLIADFENRSGNPVFDATVEQSLGLALEEASYITVFRTRDARAIARRLAPDKSDRITQEIGQLIARREGLKVLVAGAIDKRGDGYRLELRATDPATGQPIATAARNFSDTNQVLAAIDLMAKDVREALGESKTEMAKVAAAETVTAGSLQAIRAYVRAQELSRANKIPEALEAYQEAVTLDPQFGRAYAGMGSIYSNYFKQPDKADENYQLAMKHLDRMTDREKYRTLGTYYLNVVRNYEKAVENYETLVRLFPADDVGHGNLALAYLQVGNLPRAVEEVRRALAIYPRNSLQRYNYVMYSMYAGDFATSITEATKLLEENPSFEVPLLPLALSRIGQGDVNGGKDAYSKLEASGAQGASMATLGRADLEMYLGRHRAAVALLRTGIAADRKADNLAAVAHKDVALAEAYLALGDTDRAAAAANEALKLSRRESTMFPAAVVLLHTGRYEAAADQTARDLDNMLQRQTTAYARLIRGQIAAKRGQLAEAIEAFRDAQKRHDSWFGRYLLGKLYVETNHFAEAIAELELSVKRRGETTDVFFYDMPTLRYLPPAYYWLARAQEGLGGTAEARKNYELFLSLRQEADPADPLAADARRRVSAR